MKIELKRKLSTNQFVLGNLLVDSEDKKTPHKLECFTLEDPDALAKPGRYPIEVRFGPDVMAPHYRHQLRLEVNDPDQGMVGLVLCAVDSKDPGEYEQVLALVMALNHYAAKEGQKLFLDIK